MRIGDSNIEDHIPFGAFRLRVRENARTVTHYVSIPGGYGTYTAGQSVSQACLSQRFCVLFPRSPQMHNFPLTLRLTHSIQINILPSANAVLTLSVLY